MALTKISGNVIKDSVSLSGNVSIGGTLTYEDVTNVDSVGLITARSGINISDTTQSSSTTTGALRVAGGVGIVKNLHVGGTITGNGSGLTGVSGVSVANQADNRLITATGTTDALNAESTLTYNGSGTLEINDSGSSYTLRGAGVTKHEIGASASDNHLVIQNNKDQGNITSDIIFKGSGAGGGTVSEKMRITNTGVGIGIAAPTSKLYVNGVSTTDIITARAADTNGVSVINILAEGTTGHSRIKFSDTAGTDGQISYTHTDRALTFAAGGTTEKLRIDSSGHIHTGYTSGFGNDHLNILASDGGGIAIASNNVGNATAGDILGSLSFQGYLNTATYSNAEARISAIVTADHTGSSAATDMVFYTKPSTTGPGSAPTERFRISSNGNLEWRNRSVKQRKHGAFLGINSAGTSDIKISGNFENNDMLRVRWAYNWNAGDGGAWGEAVIWKQYEGTKRVRYLTDVKASPLTSVSFPHSGNDIWLRWQTNAGINGWYMIDVECHGCEPFPF